MTPDTLLQHFGGPSKSVALTAEKLGVVPMTVYTWIKHGRVPYSTQCVIEKESRGRLRAVRIDEA